MVWGWLALGVAVLIAIFGDHNTDNLIYIVFFSLLGALWRTEERLERVIKARQTIVIDDTKEHRS